MRLRATAPRSLVLNTIISRHGDSNNNNKYCIPLRHPEHILYLNAVGKLKLFRQAVTSLQTRILMTTFWDSYFCLRQLVAQQVVPISAPSIQHATHLTLVPRVDSCCHYDDIPHHKPLNINANGEKKSKTAADYGRQRIARQKDVEKGHWLIKSGRERVPACSKRSQQRLRDSCSLPGFD